MGGAPVNTNACSGGYRSELYRLWTQESRSWSHLMKSSLCYAGTKYPGSDGEEGGRWHRQGCLPSPSQQRGRWRYRRERERLQVSHSQEWWSKEAGHQNVGGEISLLGEGPPVHWARRQCGSRAGKWEQRSDARNSDELRWSCCWCKSENTSAREQRWRQVARAWWGHWGEADLTQCLIPKQLTIKGELTPDKFERLD